MVFNIRLKHFASGVGNSPNWPKASISSIAATWLEAYGTASATTGTPKP
ncbi:MAG: hypothetical protein ABIU20_04340 [Blastocatellia bacterium]